MSYQVLARKWRPQTFQAVVGQTHVLTALENGLAQNRLHHAYLFSGTRGVGKTTIARLLAKGLNCEQGVTSTPCGQCANCQAIDQGRFVDLLEIDAASRTKVDDTRELLDNVQYKPAQGRYKVYLIDEVHMLSKHSFNALLKTLEEPPEYVKFLLATTDPQKLPITVLSRCLQFHLKAILPEQIEQQLVDILTHEQATFDLPALTVIAKAADGSMRDALSLTDQALAFGAGHIDYDAVLKMLGTIDQSHLYYLLHFIASGNSQKVFEKIQEFVHLGADFSALHQDLANLCHQVALAQLQLNANVTNKTPVQLLAERLTPEEVQLFYQIAIQGYKDFSYAPNGKVALEMTVMRLLAFKPANYVDVDEAMLAEAEQVVAQTIPEAAPQPAITSVDTTSAKTTLAPPSAVANTQTVNIPIQQNVSPVMTEQQATTVNPQAAEVVNSQATQIQSPVVEVPVEQAQPQMMEPDNTASNPSSVSDNVSHDAANNNTVNPSETAETKTESFAPSNSRNMLRSHRLKREALKKTQATAEPISDDVEQTVAPVKTNQPASNINRAETQATSHVDTQTQTPSSPLVQPSVEAETTVEKSVAPVVEAKPEVVSALASPTVEPVDNDSMLPPLSSYQEQPTQAHYEGPDPAEFEYYSAPVEQAETAPFTAPATTPSNTPVENTAPVVEQGKNEVPAVVPTVQNQDISGLHQGAQYDVTFETNTTVAPAEFDIAAYVEDKMTDPWFLAIKEMQLVGFEKLLAKSCVMQQSEGSILLTLHEPQQHLINNTALCDALKAKIKHFYGHQGAVNITAGEVQGEFTPIALEMRVYQEYLAQAKASLKSDPIVQTFVQDYGAKVYENSIVPL